MVASGVVLPLAFGLGMLHALNADHVVAVAGLAARCRSRRAVMAANARWAIGHGLSLWAIGAAVLLLDMAVPEDCWSGSRSYADQIPRPCRRPRRDRPRGAYA